MVCMCVVWCLYVCNVCVGWCMCMYVCVVYVWYGVCMCIYRCVCGMCGVVHVCGVCVCTPASVFSTMESSQALGVVSGHHLHADSYSRGNVVIVRSCLTGILFPNAIPLGLWCS